MVVSTTLVLPSFTQVSRILLRNGTRFRICSIATLWSPFHDVLAIPWRSKPCFADQAPPGDVSQDRSVMTVPGWMPSTRRGLAKDKVDVEAGRGQGDLVDESLRSLVVADAQNRGDDGPAATFQEHHLLRQALEQDDGDGVVDAGDAAADHRRGVDPDALARVLPDQGPPLLPGDMEASCW